MGLLFLPRAGLFFAPKKAPIVRSSRSKRGDVSWPRCKSRVERGRIVEPVYGGSSPQQTRLWMGRKNPQSLGTLVHSSFLGLLFLNDLIRGAGERDALPCQSLSLFPIRGFPSCSSRYCPWQSALSREVRHAFSWRHCSLSYLFFFFPLSLSLGQFGSIK